MDLHVHDCNDIEHHLRVKVPIQSPRRQRPHDAHGHILKGRQPKRHEHKVRVSQHPLELKSLPVKDLRDAEPRWTGSVCV